MTPVLHQIYQHRYGGVYIVDDVATHTVTKERLVIYSHIYPFDQVAWARPYDEWCDGRFTSITAERVEELLAKDRETFQREITEAKQAAK